MLLKTPSKFDIEESHKRISDFIRKTPVLTSQSINKLCGCEIFFKCENFQKIGAFKARGATNAVLSANPEQLIRGVATHSSGNHATALSYAAKITGIDAYIVMPQNSKKIKVNSVKAFGGEITFSENNQQSREKTLQEVVDKTGAYFIHPYNNYDIIAGQATAAKELIENNPNLDFIIAPVGGGGLLSGTSLSVKYFSATTAVFGAEPEGADDAFRSFNDTVIYPSVNPKTIADGLLTSLGDKTYPIIKENVKNIFTVPDSGILAAMRLIYERLKIVIEPSSATVLAVILKYPEIFKGSKTGLILSGGNIDLFEINRSDINFEN